MLKFKLLLFLLLDVYILKSANSKQEGSTFELGLKKLDNTSIQTQYKFYDKQKLMLSKGISCNHVCFEIQNLANHIFHIS